MPRWYADGGCIASEERGYVMVSQEEVELMPGSYTYCYLKDREAYTAVILPMPLHDRKICRRGVNLGITPGTVTAKVKHRRGAIVEYETSKRAFYADFEYIMNSILPALVKFGIGIFSVSYLTKYWIRS